MNILFLCDEYPPCQHGGIGTVTSVLARELVRNGHKVIVCGFYPYYRKALSYQNDYGVLVYRYFYGNRLTLKLSKHSIAGKFVNIIGQFYSYLENVRKLIREQKIDIMEGPDYNEIFRYTGPRFISFPDFEIPMVVKIHGGDSFFSYIKHNTINEDILFRKEKMLLDSADSILAISEFSQSVIKKIFKYEKDIPVIYNGIEIDKPVAYHEDPERKTVVFAGTITEKKGIFSLIKAWEDVIEQIPDANLHIYGKGSKRMLKHLSSLINGKMIGSVHIKGFTDKENLEQIYTSATCAVFPSFAESFGMAPLEAMVKGCPTIFTSRTSGPELINNGEDGLLVDPGNTRDLSTAIIYLLRNRDKALELGEKGAKKVIRRFDISLIAKRHISLYEELIKKRGNS
ncbi:MAG TPA: glycosyltransferase family 4 protein [Bacteroidales bacterium]|nr:glycosyltransferase family 4 protein [Bacteroidales bacterium]